MLLWLNGMTNGQAKHPIETMMDDFTTRKEKSILPLLAEDEFFIQAKNLNFRVAEFIKKEAIQIAQQFLELIVQDIQEVNESNYDNVAVFPLLAVEFFELDLLPLTDLFLNPNSSQLFLQNTFALLLIDSPLPEPQWANLQRLFNLLITKDPVRISQFLFNQQEEIQLTYVHRFLNHLYSATVTAMMIQIYNPESHPGKDYSEIKLNVIQMGFKGIEMMDELSMLNFTYLIHEVMTRFFATDNSQILINYLIGKDLITQMFSLLRLQSKNMYLTKSCAHILSLISNYYSYSMQNIVIDNMDDNAPETVYHKQLTQQFENSEFMLTILPNLVYLQEQFTETTQTFKTLRLKLLEIFDNLVRISNLKLWTELSSLKILNLIIAMYLQNPKANIFHSLFEKLFLYIFNRAISDFHPYWTQELIYKIDIYTLIAQHFKENPKIDGHLYLLANHLNWFQRELSEKIVIDGSTAKYYKILKELEENILLNDDWRQAQEILYKINQQNRIQLGTLEISARPQSDIVVTLKQDDESTAIPKTIFNKVKQVSSQFQSVSGDTPAEFDASPEPDINDEFTEQVQVSNSFQDTNQEEIEYNYEPVLKSTPKKEITNQIEKQIIIENAISKSPTQDEQTYNFVQQIFLEQSPTKIQTTEIKEEIPKEPILVANPMENSPKQSILPIQTTPPKKSINLQEYVVPLSAEKIQKYQSLSSPQSDIQKDSSSKQNVNSRKLSDEKVIPTTKVEQIIHKYQGLSKSQNFGQATQQIDEFDPYANSLSLSRKQSMESSLRLKQLDSDNAEEFKIIKSLNDEDHKCIVQPNDQRILVVDELDILKPKCDSLNVSINNTSFDSRGGKKLKVHFKASKINSSLKLQQQQQENNSQVSAQDIISSPQSYNYQQFQQKINQELPQQINEQKEGQITSTSEGYIPMLNMRDSMVSNKSGTSAFSSVSNIDRKFRKISNQDQKFLNFIQNIK